MNSNLLVVTIAFSAALHLLNRCSFNPNYESDLRRSLERKEREIRPSRLECPKASRLRARLEENRATLEEKDSKIVQLESDIDRLNLSLSECRKGICSNPQRGSLQRRSPRARTARPAPRAPVTAGRTGTGPFEHQGPFAKPFGSPEGPAQPEADTVSDNAK